MITDKEYPATHSMATSWYCVDEDGNVGIFDIDDNGPIPVGEYRQNCVDEVFYEDFTFDEAQFKRLHLSPIRYPRCWNLWILKMFGRKVSLITGK